MIFKYINIYINMFLFKKNNTKEPIIYDIENQYKKELTKEIIKTNNELLGSIEIKFQ